MGTGFTVAFTHLRTGAPCKDRLGLLNVILAEGLNLGLSKMTSLIPPKSNRTNRARDLEQSVMRTWIYVAITGRGGKASHRQRFSINLLMARPVVTIVRIHHIIAFRNE